MTNNRNGKAVLVLEDGRVFTGTTFGAPADVALLYLALQARALRTPDPGTAR